MGGFNGGARAGAKGGSGAEKTRNFQKKQTKGPMGPGKKLVRAKTQGGPALTRKKKQTQGRSPLSSPAFGGENTSHREPPPKKTVWAVGGEPVPGGGGAPPNPKPTKLGGGLVLPLARLKLFQGPGPGGGVFFYQRDGKVRAFTFNVGKIKAQGPENGPGG